MELKDRIAQLDALSARATQGPYFIANDRARDAPAHRDSGLALIDTGRDGDWPVLRLGEWPTTHFIATLLNAWPELRDMALRGLYAQEAHQQSGSAAARADDEPCEILALLNRLTARAADRPRDIEMCAVEQLNWRDESLWLKKLVARLSTAQNKREVCALVAESMRERYRFIDEVLSKQRENT
jgi:hypothetical protein